MADSTAHAITAAHRPGGKFAAMVAASTSTTSDTPSSETTATTTTAEVVTEAAPEPRHGKFMPPPQQQQPEQQKGLQIPIPTSTISQINKKKREETQIALFSDLDQAESLVLDLLKIASSTTKSLSEMTTTTSLNINENSKALVKNQDEYLSKLKKIHDLLSPHAHLVVAYSNHKTDNDNNGLPVEKKASPSSTSSQLNPKDIKSVAITSTPQPNSVIVIDVDEDATATPTTTDTNNKTLCNMYAARIERRLALERRDVIKLFLENEKTSNKEMNHKRKLETLDNDNEESSLVNDTNKKQRVEDSTTSEAVVIV